MTPKTIQVQIPYHIFVELKQHAEQMDDEAFRDELFKFVEWAAGLWTETNLPVVQWCIGSMVLPDVFGYLYTHWLVLNDLGKIPLNK